MAVAAMQGTHQHIMSRLGFSILPKNTSTCRLGESNQWTADNKTQALPLCHNHLHTHTYRQTDMHAHATTTGFHIIIIITSVFVIINNFILFFFVVFYLVFSCLLWLNVYIVLYVAWKPFSVPYAILFYVSASVSAYLPSIKMGYIMYVYKFNIWSHSAFVPNIVTVR